MFLILNINYMAKEQKKNGIIRSAYVQKCIESNELYTLFFGLKDSETTMEFPKVWFRGVGRPKKGSKITIRQENGETTMLINNKQFYPSLHPLSRTEILSRKK